MSTHTNNDMNSSNRTIKGFFRFGRHKSDVIDFQEDTTVADINHYIYQSFKDIVPSTFHIEFYNVGARKVSVLDEDLLRSENNPFLFDPTDCRQETTDPMDYVQLFIVDDSPPMHEIDFQCSMYNFL